MELMGKKIKFKQFEYTNKFGGTGIAENKTPIIDTCIKFNGVASGTIVKAFEDYETGWVFHVILDPEYWKLIEHVAMENKAYVSEFDLVPRRKI